MVLEARKDTCEFLLPYVRSASSPSCALPITLQPTPTPASHSDAPPNIPGADRVGPANPHRPPTPMSADDPEPGSSDAGPSSGSDESGTDLTVHEHAPEPGPLEERASSLPNAPEQEPMQAEDDPELVELWLSGKSEHTRRAYRRDFEEFVDRVDKPIQAILLKDVQGHKAFLEEKGLKPATISRKIACIKSLFTFAHKIGYVQFNVGRAVRQPKVRRRLNEKLLSVSEVHALIHSARETAHPQRNEVILRLFYTSGIRRSELADLHWRDTAERSDLDPPRGQVTVWGKGSQERTVVVTEPTWREMEELRARQRAEGRGERDDPLFLSRQGGPLSESAIYRVVKKAAERAGIDDKPVSPHSFRHAHITHALQNGASLHVVMETVGHSSMQITSDYSHARPDESSSDFLSD